MPIKLVTRHTKDEGDLSSPAVICDYCGEEITDARLAMYQWLSGEPPSGELFFTHKQCCDNFWAAHGGEFPEDGSMWCWGELSWFIPYLAYNLKVKSVHLDHPNLEI